MGTYDNFDELYEDEESTSATESLGETIPEAESLVETYDPENPPDDGKPNNNRIFMIALGVLAAVFIVSIIAMIFFASRNLPARQQQMTETAAAVIAFNEQTIVAATLSAEEQAAEAELTRIASEWTATPLPTEVVVAKATEVPEEEPTSTVIVVQPAAEEAETTPTVDPAVIAAQTATIEGLLTQVAAEATATEVIATPNEAQLTATQNAAVLDASAESGGGTELPDTGILDDGNIYWMGGGALLMVAVIIITRKLRKS